MNAKQVTLFAMLKKYRRVLIAYSGGVDSTYLLAAAREALGKENLLAVTAVSETYPAAERARAKRLARTMDINHRLIFTAELRNKKFSSNPVNRCFYCKDELFRKLASLAKKQRMVLCDATNYSDRSDFRPGRKAALKWGVLSPLLKAKMTKDDIRAASRIMRLPTWNLPAQACLASRFPYGTPLSAVELRRVEKGEIQLRSLGFSCFRLRNHGDIARLEIEKSEIPLLFSKNIYDKIVRYLKKLGWRFITVDLEGYRTGSLNPSSTPK